MENIYGYLQEVHNESVIKDLSYNEDEKSITFRDKRGEWKLIEELSEVCECSNHSKAKILLDDFIQGFVCEKCIKAESQSNPQYIFSNYVAYFETKGF